MHQKAGDERPKKTVFVIHWYLNRAASNSIVSASQTRLVLMPLGPWFNFRQDAGRATVHDITRTPRRDPRVKYSRIGWRRRLALATTQERTICGGLDAEWQRGRAGWRMLIVHNANRYVERKTDPAMPLSAGCRCQAEDCAAFAGADRCRVQGGGLLCQMRVVARFARVPRGAGFPIWARHGETVSFFANRAPTPMRERAKEIDTCKYYLL